MTKPSLVLPNLHSLHLSNSNSVSNLSPSSASTADPSPPIRTGSRRPPLTIASVSSSIPNNHHHRHASISSHRTHRSNGSITLSTADGLSTGTTPSSCFDQIHQHASSTSPEVNRETKYPTTSLTAFDPDDEDGGRINDPRQIINEICNAMNGLNPSPGALNSHSEFGAQPTSASSRSRSGSSVSIRPIPVRRPRTADNATRSASSEPRVGSFLAPPLVDQPGLEDDVNELEEVEFEPQDLQVLDTLGEGAGGEVKKVLHRPTGLYMAKKVYLHLSLSSHLLIKKPKKTDHPITLQSPPTTIRQFLLHLIHQFINRF